MSSNIGFSSEMLNEIQNYEDHHWWFQCRNSLITTLISRFIHNDTGSFLEIGCGNGCVTKAIADSHPGLSITATEYFEDGLEFARNRVPSAHFQQLDARKLKGSPRYDGIGAFDVLEHIDDDRAVLQSISTALKSTGVFFLSVPQHKWLWSTVDEHAQHERRYSRDEMLEKLRTAGFEPIYITSYVALLLPLMWIMRRKSSSHATHEIKNEFSISSFLNVVLGLITRFEAVLRRIGCPLPLGGSLVIVAKLKDTTFE